MAAFTGSFLGSEQNFIAKTSTAPAWSNEILWRPSIEAFDQVNPIQGGTRAAPTNATNTNSHTGKNLGLYADIFYNRIIIEPIILTLGAISNQVVTTLVVFNAFFDARTLDAVNESITGLTVTGITIPKIFQPLEVATSTITVSVDGPPSIIGNITYDWAVPTNDFIVPVTGTRLTPWPYEFRKPTEETLEWLTDIITSYDGSEQRINIRKGPRQSFSVKAFLRQDEIFQLDNVLYDWRGRLWALPIFSEQRTLTSIYTADDPTIEVSTLFGSFRIEGQAIIFSNSENFEIFTIQALPQVI